MRSGEQSARPKMTTPSDHVRTDEQGVLRVGNSRVMLDSVVAAYLQGHSAETIQQQFPTLTLGAVYGAIAHYLEHQPAIDDYLRGQQELWQLSRDAWNARSGVLVQRLREEQRLAAARS